MTEQLLGNQNKVAGLWLAFGGLLLAIVLPVHGPINSDLSVQMSHIAEGYGKWSVAHWLAFVSLIALTGAGLMFTIETALGRGMGAPLWAWVLFALGSFVTVVTAVTEATAISTAAESGDFESFVIWWQFASGFGNGFMLVGLATIFIAWSAGKNATKTVPVWSCKLAAAVAVASVVGWIMNQHFGIEIGGLIWFASTLLMSLWLAWFGAKWRSEHS